MLDKRGLTPYLAEEKDCLYTWLRELFLYMAEQDSPNIGLRWVVKIPD
jgi:hypothetical protein